MHDHASFYNQMVDKGSAVLASYVNQQVEARGTCGGRPALPGLPGPRRSDPAGHGRALAAGGDASVGELAAPYDVSVQAVSKHVKVLEEAGLVSRTRDAQRRPCHLEAEVFDLMTKWIERYRREAEERFAAAGRGARGWRPAGAHDDTTPTPTTNNDSDNEEGAAS